MKTATTSRSMPLGTICIWLSLSALFLSFVFNWWRGYFYELLTPFFILYPLVLSLCCLLYSLYLLLRADILFFSLRFFVPLLSLILSFCLTFLIPLASIADSSRFSRLEPTLTAAAVQILEETPESASPTVRALPEAQSRLSLRGKVTIYQMGNCRAVFFLTESGLMWSSRGYCYLSVPDSASSDALLSTLFDKYSALAKHWFLCDIDPA